MCTVSWSLEKGGYRLFFNRDEQLTRVAGEPPMQWAHAAGIFYGPKDPLGGGSWIGVNPSGWTTAILNYYDAPATSPTKGLKSRGQLVVSLAPLSDPLQVQAFLQGLVLEDYGPFHLLRVSPVGGGQLWTSDGEHLAHEQVGDQKLPITSSSFDTARVIARRKAIYSALNAGGASSSEALTMFHRHFDTSDMAASVSMRRKDAETVSLSEIWVKPKEIRFDYYVRAEEGPGYQSPITLKIARTK